MWGTGSASREYLYVDDAAAGHRGRRRALRGLGAEPINLGTNHEVTIRETVETIARLVGFTGELRWDPTKPDGQPRRRVDATRASELLGWHATTPFEDGLRATIDWYLANRAEAERAPPETPRFPQARFTIFDSFGLWKSLTGGRGRCRRPRRGLGYAAARLDVVSWALRPLGFGTTHSSAPASDSG